MGGRIRACNRARPDPGNDVGLAATIFFGQTNFGIKVAELLDCAFLDDTAVVANIGGNTVCLAPGLGSANRAAGIGVDGLLISPAWREFKIALVKEHRN